MLAFLLYSVLTQFNFALQCKVLLVAPHLVLHLVTVHHHHTVELLSMPSPSLHMVLTQATLQQQQPQLTQGMEVATLSLEVTVVTLRYQLHLTADSQATVVLVLVGMTHMAHLVSKLMEVLGVMDSSQLSQQHSQQVVDNGRNCRTMRAGHITTTRSQASASGIVPLTCERLMHSSSRICQPLGQQATAAAVPDCVILPIAVTCS